MTPEDDDRAASAELARRAAALVTVHHPEAASRACEYLDHDELGLALEILRAVTQDAPGSEAALLVQQGVSSLKRQRLRGRRGRP